MFYLKRFAILLASTVCFFACGQNDNAEKIETEKGIDKKEAQVSTEPKNELVAAIEQAHKADIFRSNEALSFDLKLTFGGKERFNGTIFSTTNSSKIKMVRKSDGAAAIFNGEGTYISPDTAEWRGAQFGVFTWQYFFMAPYKFSDPGTQWEITADRKISGQAYNSGKLTFEPGTGDAPDDWYIAYSNKETGMLDGMAYIVTYGGVSQEEALENAHAVYYTDIQTLRNQIPIATKWQFFNWNEEEGFNGDQIGEASISNIQFYKNEKDLFLVPQNAAKTEN